MCGICGAIGFQDGPGIARRMAGAMVHRGPDGEGYLDRDGVSLGMRRLKIIDLSGGDQPIYNEDRSVGVILNGEIYNYRELRDELERLGHRFATHSDTETIAHAYEQWGAETPSRLRGMFALAVLDFRDAPGDNRQPWMLMLARDSLGIKPLYFWKYGQQMLFASEVRALLASGQIDKRISAAGLYTYLGFGSVQEPLTLVEEIYSLQPGTTMLLKWNEAGLDIQKASYWEPPFQGSQNPTAAEVQGWLAEAIGCHLESEVPLGAFLSGGLDSGSIVALGSRAMNQPMRTFTIAFEGWMGDEQEAALLTSQRWKSEHQTRTVSQEEIVAEIDKAIEAMDQPTVDGINSWYICREAKRAGLTVALSGVGGDELFGGYPSFRQVPALKRLPHPLPGVKHLPGWENGWGIPGGSPDGRRKLALYLDGDTRLEHPYFSVRGLFTNPAAERLIKPAMLEKMSGQPALGMWEKSVQEQAQRASRYDRIGEVSWLELSQYMLSTLLRDTDMMSMAHSLEVRVPMADHRLVERILAVGWGAKTSGGGNKPLLGAAMEGLLPEQVLRRRKTTFTFPFETWVRQGLAERVRDRLNSVNGCLRLWADTKETARLWMDYEAKRTNWARPWAVYALDEWVERNLG